MRTPTLISAVILLLAGPVALAAGDPAAGEQKSQTCAACHGPDGNSVNPVWPSLAGQHAEYIAKQLHDFKSGSRKNAQMSPMAAPLSDADIADLAAYFSSKEQKPLVAKPESVEDGQRLYRAGNAATGLPACMACHGPNGAGNPAAMYPAIAGQHGAYTALQLKAYKAEERSNDDKGIMRTIASRLTNKDIEALSEYLQGLH